MRFVRKPKPYTSGPLSNLSWPRFQRPVRAQPHLGQRASPRPLSKPRPTRASRTPANWGQRSVTALAVLGTVVVLLIGGSALYNQLGREAQFTAVATHLADLGR